MQYLFLTASVVSGLAGVRQALDCFSDQGKLVFSQAPVELRFQCLVLSIHPLPGFIHCLLLGMAFFILFLVWLKLKRLGLYRFWMYVPG